MNTKELQERLLALGYYLGTSGPKKDGVDGDFGRITIQAVKDFQRDYGVQVQWPGTVGAKTEAALDEAYAAKLGDKQVVPAPSGSLLLPWYETAKRLQGVKEVVG